MMQDGRVCVGPRRRMAEAYEGWACPYPACRAGSGTIKISITQAKGKVGKDESGVGKGSRRDNKRVE